MFVFGVHNLRLVVSKPLVTVNTYIFYTSDVQKRIPISTDWKENLLACRIRTLLVISNVLFFLSISFATSKQIAFAWFSSTYWDASVTWVFYLVNRKVLQRSNVYNYFLCKLLKLHICFFLFKIFIFNIVTSVVGYIHIHIHSTKFL